MKMLLTGKAVVTSSGVVGDAVLVDRGRVERVGRATDLRDPDIVENAYPEGFIVPGLRDAHLHLGGWSALLGGLDLDHIANLGELAEAVRGHAARLDPERPVIGNRLDDTRLTEGRLPTRLDLDRILDRQPILLYRHCGHIAVANTAALQLAGVGSDTPDPPGGRLDRTDQGEPTGVLRESAIRLVSATLSPRVADPPPDRLLVAAHRLVKTGITRIDTMVSCGVPMWCDAGDELDDLLAVTSDLPLDVTVWVITEEPDDLRKAARRIRESAGRLRFGGWKGFSDGSLGGHTAALRDPYADERSTTGMLLLDHDRHSPLAATSQTEGGGVAVHAIGDRAVDATLGWFRRLIDGGTDPAGLRIEHASMMGPDAIATMARLGVTASVQPAFVTSDAPWVGTRVGGQRLPTVHPFASMLAAGIPLVGGSDAPVESPDPWNGMAAATRHATAPSESLSAGPALGLFGGDTPRPGEPADFVVIDRDPLDPEELDHLLVKKVMVGGRFV